MREEVKSSLLCTIMVSKKDPNQDIAGRFGWEIFERKPNWIPKVCWLIQTAVFRLSWNGEGKKFLTYHKFRMVLPYSWHCTCHHGIGLKMLIWDAISHGWEFTSYRPTSQGRRLTLKVTSHRPHIGITMWTRDSSQAQRNIHWHIPFFIIYRKPDAHRKYLGHLSRFISTSLWQIVCY